MTDQILIATYDYRLVGLSVLIASLASYTSFDLGGRVTASRRRARLAWMAGGGVSMGIGIWAMHYTGMLAFRLPIPIQYDWPTTILSFAAAVFTSLVALFVVSRRNMGLIPTLTGSALMGGGIVALHYIAMASMRVQATCHYFPPLVMLSVLIAVAGSWLALTLTFFFREERPGRRMRKVASSVAMGSAIAGMHYTAMAAGTFTPSTLPPDVSHAVSISTLGIAAVGGVPVMVLLLTILTSIIDRLQTQRTLLDELFEQLPEAVALVDRNESVLRINRAFTRTFGYTLPESLGRKLSHLILCLESRDQGYWEIVKRGQRVDTEDVCRRKDGRHLDVAVVLVPFAIPGGETAIYAIYRDITERKRADDALRELSGQLLQSQDEERRRLARDLHDSTGQKLAALAMNLAVVEQSRAALDPRSERALAESVTLTHESLREIRTLAYLLHPPELDELGLFEAVNQYVSGFVQRSGIPVDLKLTPDPGRLPREVETALFRILQESLNNIQRHSGTARASVEIFRSPSGVTMKIADQGQGLRESGLKSDGVTPAMPGVGIAGMRERVAQLGGRLDIHSADHGTSLEAFLPLN
jgi:PAS domain S-box-containing protein